jgi:hypothetical protein
MIGQIINLVVFIAAMVVLKKMGLGAMAWVIVLMPLLVIGLFAFFIWYGTRTVGAAAAAAAAEKIRLAAKAAVGTAQVDADSAAQEEREAARAANRTTCPSGQYLHPSSVNADVKICSACGHAKFKADEGSEQCIDWKNCPVGQGMTAAGTTTTDITCANCDGITNFSAYGDDRNECSAVTECAAGEIETTAPSASSDRVCGANPQNAESYYNYDPMAYSELNYDNFN